MIEISNKQINEIGEYWLIYAKENGAPGHIQLSACANNFSIHRGFESGDGMKCVGLRYEKDGFGCYELFNVGHTLVKCPLKPNPLQRLLKGGKAEAYLREQYLDIEKQLNSYGWKTIEE